MILVGGKRPFTPTQKRLVFGSAFLVCSSLSCAPNAPAESPKTDGESQEQASTGPEEVAPLPALDPVPTPEGVIARFRLLDPKKLADGLLDATSVPFDLAVAMRSVKGNYSFLQAMDLSAPIEAAAVLNPEDPLNPSRFLSVGVVGVDDVLKHLERSKISVQEGPGGVHHFLIGTDPCAVGRSLGKSPARVVCSDRRGGLHLLLPYALRGFPTEQLSQADVYTRLDFKPVRSRYKKELDRLRLLASVFARQGHVGHAKFDRALTDAAIFIADEVTRVALESDQLSVEVVEKAGQVTVTTRAVFDGQASTTVQSLRTQATAQGPAPAAFGQLPSTSAAAFYLRELPAKSLDAWMSIVVDLLTGYAEYKGASSEFSTRLGRVVRFLGPAGRTHVLAQGPIVSSIDQGRALARPAWSLWGVAAPKATVVEFFDDLAWVLHSPDWAKVIEAPEVGGKLKRANKRLKGVTGATLYEWSVNELPVSELNHSVDPDDTVSSDQLKKTVDLLSRGLLAVHEWNGTSYVSWVTGESTSSLSEAFSALEAKDVERVSQVSHLQPFLNEPAVAAGYMTLGGAGGELWSFAPQQIIKDLTGLLNATPYRGLVPLTMRYQVQAESETAATSTLIVPREFLQDAATLAAILFSEMDVE